MVRHGLPALSPPGTKPPRNIRVRNAGRGASQPSLQKTRIPASHAGDGYPSALGPSVAETLLETNRRSAAAARVATTHFHRASRQRAAHGRRRSLVDCAIIARSARGSLGTPHASCFIFHPDAHHDESRLRADAASREGSCVLSRPGEALQRSVLHGRRVGRSDLHVLRGFHRQRGEPRRSRVTVVSSDPVTSALQYVFGETTEQSLMSTGSPERRREVRAARCRICSFGSSSPSGLFEGVSCEVSSLEAGGSRGKSLRGKSLRHGKRTQVAPRVLKVGSWRSVKVTLLT
jgi:hypothetical protein